MFRSATMLAYCGRSALLLGAMPNLRPDIPANTGGDRPPQDAKNPALKQAERHEVRLQVAMEPALQLPERRRATP
jgi:hypothetical protein